MGRAQIHDSTDDYIHLDVRLCKRRGYLRPGWSGTLNWSRRGEPFASIGFYSACDEITLQYKTRRRGGDWQDRRQTVAVEWTLCHFGGIRAWFRCPVCGHRAAILYGAGVFACRHCLHLAYESQRETPLFRALHKAQAIHEKLGGSGIIDEPVFKPKGMHWRKFERLSRKCEAAVHQTNVLAISRFGLNPY